MSHHDDVPWIVIGPLSALASTLITIALIVALRGVLARYALARPNARSSHKVPTPQGAGIPMLAATFAVSAVVLMLHKRFGSLDAVAVVACGAFALGIIGAADDILVLRALPRLGCQLAAATVVVMTLPDDVRLALFIPAWLERGILILSLVWFINLVNFMDGIDLITIVEVLPICTGIALISMLGAAPPFAFVIAAALGGATIGFAPFNRPIAKMFLGDVGSLPIGLILGWLLILVAGHGHLAAATLLPLYYLADATITLVKRVARGERIWEAHRTHFYQRATDRGYTVLEIVTRIFVTNVALCGLAIATVALNEIWASALAVLLGTVIVVALLLHFGKRRA